MERPPPPRDELQGSQKRGFVRGSEIVLFPKQYDDDPPNENDVGEAVRAIVREYDALTFLRTLGVPVPDGVRCVRGKDTGRLGLCMRFYDDAVVLKPHRMPDVTESQAALLRPVATLLAQYQVLVEDLQFLVTPETCVIVDPFECLWFDKTFANFSVNGKTGELTKQVARRAEAFRAQQEILQTWLGLPKKIFPFHVDVNAYEAFVADRVIAGDEHVLVNPEVDYWNVYAKVRTWVRDKYPKQYAEQDSLLPSLKERMQRMGMKDVTVNAIDPWFR
jgi:hypothetical protein